MGNLQKRIDGLDFLRGMASLGVCWFHLTSWNPGKETSAGFYEIVRLSGKYGWLGVEVFFVISGFVIPYSLHRAKYQLKAYPTFLLKRIIRLDPPYLVSIIMVLMLAYVFAFRHGEVAQVEGMPVSAARVLLHLGYLNIFFGNWLNPVYWTLAIEFQYYLMVGLVYPLLRSQRRSVRLGTFFCLSALWFSGGRLISGEVVSSTFIVHFIFLFFMGILTFQHRVNIIGKREYLTLLVLSTVGCYLTLGLPPTLAGLFAVYTIHFYERTNKAILNFFGKISYSLYLLHWPIGLLTMTLVHYKLLRAEGAPARILVLFIGLGVCVLSAYLLYVFVEKPAQQWSARFGYGAPSGGDQTEKV
jgi:peptidoglycan/LPS O-acetylase OafA/YrhL